MLSGGMCLTSGHFHLDQRCFPLWTDTEGFMMPHKELLKALGLLTTQKFRPSNYLQQPLLPPLWITVVTSYIMSHELESQCT